MVSLTVIVPCYNEESLIEKSHFRICSVLQTMPILSKIIYINDGSQDRSGELLDRIAETDRNVKVLHFSRNFGHQPAVTAGIRHCTSDVAVIMDADMQDPCRYSRLMPEVAGKMKNFHIPICFSYSI